MQTNGTFFGMHQSFGHLFAGLQNESKGPGGVAFQQPVVGVFHPCVGAQLTEVAACEGELMIFCELANLNQLFNCGLVAHMTG